MKCPQTFQIEITDESKLCLAGAECGKEECAWWDTKKGQCAILTLAQSSYSLKETIQNHLIKR